jgi:saccharopine dehydrogenase (NAD+, L-lysine forming)
MTSGKLLLVGGYGHVGAVLASELAVRYPGQLIIAGRRHNQAEALAATLPGGAACAVVEVQDEESVKLAARPASLIVNCSLDQRTPTLLRAAFANASAYLDIGASATAIAGMLELSTEAAQHGTCALVGAGLDPGCTNVMAALARARAGGAHAINVALLLTAGDAFGAAAIDYILEALAHPTTVEYQGHRQELYAYRERRSCEFPSPYGRKLAYRFPFPEQAFFAETLQAQQAANWYTMGSAVVDRLLAVAVRLGLTRLLRSAGVRGATRWVFQQLSRVPGGKDDVCALAEAQGPNGTWRVSLASHQESKTTALCALPLVEALYEGRLARPGVWLPEQVVDPTAYLRALTELGLQVQVLSTEESGERPFANIQSGS